MIEDYRPDDWDKALMILVLTLIIMVVLLVGSFFYIDIVLQAREEGIPISEAMDQHFLERKSLEGKCIEDKYTVKEEGECLDR